MNDMSLNIEDVRTKCNMVIDFLLNLNIREYENTKKNCEINLKKMREKYDKRTKKCNINNDFLLKIAYIVKLGLNFFAVHCLGIEHEYLDFSSYKNQKSTVQIKLTDDSFSMRYLRVLEGNIKTLNELKGKIASDDKLTLMFFKEYIYQIAVNNVPELDVFYPTLEKMKISIYAPKEDRKIFDLPPDVSRYSKGKIIENGITEIFNSKINNKNRVASR